ncbi:hypothetical protein ACF0H5_004369 [Mactra antiquata]
MSARVRELHVPLEVCGAVVKREFDFWYISENNIKPCCWSKYRSYIENQRILEGFNKSVLKADENEDFHLEGLKGWELTRTKMWMILEFPRSSRTALVFGVVSLMFVILSILGFCLETLPDLRPVNVTLDINATRHHCDGKNITTNYILVPNTGLYILDIICTAYFTIELIVRCIFSPNKVQFVMSAMNFIDLLALVPLYMQLILNTDAFKYCYSNEGYIFEIMFILRIIRMFRIFHLVKHYQALQILVYAIKASIQELLMLLIFLLLGMLVFATMIYYAERGDDLMNETQIPTIPIGFWWAIITMTTVGYGDIAPTTPLGYIVGTCCAVCGVLMVALTIPVISNNFTLFYTHVRSRKGGDDDTEFDIRSISSTSRSSRSSLQHGLRNSNDIIYRRAHCQNNRRLEEFSTVSAEVFTLNGKFKSNCEKFYGRSSCIGEGRHSSFALSDVMVKSDDADFITARTEPVKALSDDGLTYTGWYNTVIMI